MAVTTHHVHNVLRAYSKQLGEDKEIKNRGDVAKRRDHVRISVEARRKAVIEKVTSDIVHRILHDGAGPEAVDDTSKPEEEAAESSGTISRDDSEITFKVINREKGEVVKTLSIEDSRFLKDELKEMTEEQSPRDLLRR